jgi:hypothetical protein
MQSNPPETASAVSAPFGPKTNLDPLLTEQEAAEFLGIKPSTLSVWRSTRRYNLEFVKVGACVRYRKSALQTFADSRTRGREGG